VCPQAWRLKCRLKVFDVGNSSLSFQVVWVWDVSFTTALQLHAHYRVSVIVFPCKRLQIRVCSCGGFIQGRELHSVTFELSAHLHRIMLPLDRVFREVGLVLIFS